MTEQQQQRVMEFEDEATIEAVQVGDAVPQAAAPAATAPIDRLPAPSGGEIPDWVVLPAGMKFPRGLPVLFLRFRARYYEAMGEDRQAIVWPINVADQKLAYSRSNNDTNRAIDELTKQMIRVVDGHRVNWDGLPGPGNVDQWWDQIGGANRNILHRIFTQLHVPSREQVADFFENCVAVKVGS